MWNEQEKQQFLEHGYLHVRGLLDQPRVETIRAEFEDIWGRHGRSNQHVLLQYPTFIDLIEHPPILERVGAVFGRQTQLLQYDFLRQERNDALPLRGWHRDFSFAGDRPLSMNVIVYLDEMTDERGPTYVVPGSQRDDALPPTDLHAKPMAGEVAVDAEPGAAVVVNGAN